MKDIPDRLMTLFVSIPWIILGSMIYIFMCVNNLSDTTTSPLEFYTARLGLLFGFSIMSAEFWSCIRGD